jgi:hypothetical protein
LRPLALLLGIALGSAVALFVGLSMTAVVLLFLPEFKDRFAGEWRPLLTGIGATFGLTVLAAASFAGELKGWRWRRGAQAVLAVSIAVLLWTYWP